MVAVVHKSVTVRGLWLGWTGGTRILLLFLHGIYHQGDRHNTPNSDDLYLTRRRHGICVTETRASITT